jgi:predicted MPP superfamily phosphohydrolase
MDHQPRDYAQAEAAGVDLLLSGHTHRGQFAPNHWLTRKVFELDWGYLKKGRMHAVVSSGYGTWGPALRIASRAEIVQINVRFAPLEGK